MQFEGTHGIKITQAGHRVLISRKSSPVEISAATQQPGSALSGMGFYAYRYLSATNEWSVVVSSGALQVVVAGTDPYGTFSGSTGELMDAQTFDYLTPGLDGYLVFTLPASALTDEPPVGTPGAAGNPAIDVVDFGDPAGDYAVASIAGGRYNDEPFPPVNTPTGAAPFALLLHTSPPEASRFYFQRIIARVFTDAAGVPSVYQVHIGDIEVPLAAEGYINGFSAGIVA